MVRLAFSDLPESMLARAIYDMKKRFRKLIIEALVKKPLRASLSDCNEIED
jgi:hypothetical protein